MTLSRSHLLLLGAAVLVAALAWFAPKPEEESGALVEPAKEARGSKDRQAGGGESARSTDKPEPVFSVSPRTEGNEPPPDLFKSFSWYVPPPPPPAPPESALPPPAPTAPPLPYTYIGQLDEGDKQTFMLARGEIVITARAGEQLDSNYRLESLQGSSLIITYLPLNQKQTLDVGVTQ
jgi:hypothetical protein